MAIDKELQSEYQNQIADVTGLNKQEIPASENSHLDISKILGNNRNFFDDDDGISFDCKTQLVIINRLGTGKWGFVIAPNAKFKFNTENGHCEVSILAILLKWINEIAWENKWKEKKNKELQK